MGARLTPVIAAVLAVTIVVASPLVRAQTASTPAIEALTPPAAGSVAPTSEATPSAAELVAMPAPTTTPVPGAETPASETPPATPPSAIAPSLRAEQLDQLLAPVALYPDALLAQMLMAATYPLDIVKARRWFQDPRHAALSGEQLAAALEAETWDPSIKALVTFPQILMMMDANLDWTEELGDAFMAQQADVMDAIQRLRQQAAAAGTLWSNAQQRVTEEGQGLVIEPANPAYIYPPLYSPALVYGPWPAPEYPPLDITPSDYGAGFGLPFGVSFGGAVVVVKKMSRGCTFDWGQPRIRRTLQASKAFDRAIREPARAIWRPDPTHRQWLGSFGSDAHARLAMFRNHPVPVAAIPRSAVPTVAGGLSMFSSHPAARAFAPTRMAPAALVAPQRRIAGRPMMMPQMAPRQPAARVGARFVAMAKPAPAGGASHFDGAAHH